MDCLDLKTMKWLHEPKNYLVNKDNVIMEADPYTSLRDYYVPELYHELPKNFVLSMRMKYHYNDPFDQSGIILYSHHRRQVIARAVQHSIEQTSLSTIVFHGEYGDWSGRGIGTAIDQLYFRFLQRSGGVSIQYSFSGEIYSDLRWFHVSDEEPIDGFSLYACSPQGEGFDVGFSNVWLQ